MLAAAGAALCGRQRRRLGSPVLPGRRSHGSDCALGQPVTHSPAAVSLLGEMAGRLERLSEFP